MSESRAHPKVRHHWDCVAGVVSLRGRVAAWDLHVYDFVTISRRPVVSWELWGQSVALVGLALATPAAGSG